MDEIDTLLSILENSTRRSILRKLLMEDSYGLELSKSLGVSQQAINKQLEILENANMILSMGSTPNAFGPPRKIYRPTGFFSIIIDYTPNFIQISKHISVENNTGQFSGKVSVKRLEEINAKMNELVEHRQVLLDEKNLIIHRLREEINDNVDTGLAREILIEYLESLDMEKVASDMHIPLSIVKDLVSRYFTENLSSD
jgi:Predicted transcriptional regulators